MQPLRTWVFGLFLGILSTPLVWSQPLQADQSLLVFPPTFENARDSQTLLLANPFLYPVTVTQSRTFSIYGQPAFVVDTDTFTIPAQGQKALKVFFEPRHNIQHRSQLVLITGSPGGALSIDLQGQGRFSNSYYNSTENLTEEALKLALKNRLNQGAISLSYNFARDAMFMTVDNKKVNGQGAAVNTLECVYTGTEATGYTNRSDAQTNYNFNTEHTFPQSLFNQTLPQRSDLHHLFPTTATSNSQRANLPFGEVSGNGIWNQGGSKHNGSIFEPRDQHKGVVARALLYFVLRHQDYGNFVLPQESILRQWHQQFGPDSIAKKRNDDVFGVQGNRNPLVDYPQFAERITSFTSNSLAPDEPGLFLSADRADLGDYLYGDSGPFRLVLVNQGNVVITVAGFEWSKGLFRLAHPLNDTTLLPGEALDIDIEPEWNVAGPVNDTLVFATDLNASSIFRIPVQAEVSGTNSLISRSSPQIKIFPNPTKGVVTISLPTPQSGKEIFLFDQQGRLVFLSSWPAGMETLDLKLPDLPGGLYRLQIATQRNILTEKLVIFSTH